MMNINDAIITETNVLSSSLLTTNSQTLVLPVQLLIHSVPEAVQECFE